MGDSVRHRRTSGAEAPQFGLCYVAPEGGDPQDFRAAGRSK